MLMQFLKVTVINRETSSQERARNKEREGTILSATAAPGAGGKQGRPAMDILSSHSEAVIAIFYFRDEFKWIWTVNRVPRETLKSGNIKIKIIIIFTIEIKIIGVCSTIWERLLANYS